MSTVRSWHQRLKTKFCFRKSEGVVSRVKDKDWRHGDKLVKSDARPVNKQNLEEIQQKWDGSGLDSELGRMAVPITDGKGCSTETCLVALTSRTCTTHFSTWRTVLWKTDPLLTPFFCNVQMVAQSQSMCHLYFYIRTNTLTFLYPYPQVTATNQYYLVLCLVLMGSFLSILT